MSGEEQLLMSSWLVHRQPHQEYGLGYKVGPFTQSQEPNPRLSERACARAGEEG